VGSKKNNPHISIRLRMQSPRNVPSGGTITQKGRKSAPIKRDEGKSYDGGPFRM